MVDALPCDTSQADAIDPARAPWETLLIRATDGREHALLRQGGRQIQLLLRSGTFANGPVYFHYALEGLQTLEAKLLTLRRLLALHGRGRFPNALFPVERRARRWIMILRTIDGLQSGASQREIAVVLFGGEAVQIGWRGRSDYLRLRVQRLVRGARDLVDGSYIALLGERSAADACLDS
jgi:hypothetical protein